MMRSAIYVHLLATAICASFSLADRGLFFGPEVSQLVEQLMELLLVPCLIAWVICRLVVIITVLRSRSERRLGYWAIAAEVALCYAQILALLPAVQ